MNRYSQFFQKVLDMSVSDNWYTTVTEWKITSCTVCSTTSESCICGHENIKYNKFNAEKDYEFMLDRYNRRKRLTTKQSQKVYVLINRQIVPKLQELSINGFTTVVQPASVDDYFDDLF